MSLIYCITNSVYFDTDDPEYTDADYYCTGDCSECKRWEEQ